MKKLRHKIRILCLVITIPIINLGCTYHLPPIFKEVSAKLGTIGVCTSSHNAYLYFPKKPVTGWGKGCGTGVDIVFQGLENMFKDPGMVFLWPIIIPVWFVVVTPIGCISGALSAESESEVQEAEALLRKVFDELNIKETLQYHFLRSALGKTPYKFVVLGNIEFDDIKYKPNYSSLADIGVDTVLWIDISKIGLTTGRTSAIDPSLRFSMSCSIELIRAKDGEVVYRYILKMRGDDDEFVDWADNNAKLFSKEFNRCTKNIAEKIVEDLFLTLPFEGE